jgi:hypothetical protein
MAPFSMPIKVFCSCIFSIVLVVSTVNVLLLHGHAETIGITRRTTAATTTALQRTAQNDSQPLRIANFLLGGAQKAGTTSIAVFLMKNHKHLICSPNCKGNKEVHFFDQDHRFSQGLELYHEHFRHCQDYNITLDATPNYIMYPERIKEIYEKSGTASNLKIIFSLREPTSREISLYSHKVVHSRDRNPQNWTRDVLKDNGETMSFEEYMDKVLLPNQEQTLELGRYARLLKRWFDLFDRKQILLLSYHELKTNETAFMERILQFLNLPMTEQRRLPKRNMAPDSLTDDAPPCSVQNRLFSLFEPFNSELYTLLDQNLGPEVEQRPFPKFELGCNE